MSELRKHTLLLYDGDYLRIQELFPEIGAAVIIRKLIRSYLEKIAEGDTVPTLTDGVKL